MVMQKFLNHLTNLIIALFFSSSLVYAVTTSFQLPYAPWYILLLVSLTLVICSLIFYNKLSFWLTTASLAFLLLCGAILLYAKGNLYKLSDKSYAFANWIYNYASGPYAFNKEFSLYTLIALCTLIALLTYVFAIKAFKFYIILISYSAVFIVLCINNYPVSTAAFYVFLAAIIVYYLKHLYIKSAVKENFEFTQNSVLLIWASILCTLVLIISLTLPFRQTPVEWKWLDAKLNTAYNYFNRIYNNYSMPRIFSIGYTGFGGSNTLGGKVKLDSTLVLKVDSPRRVYLKGTTRDFYTGSAWINSDENKTAGSSPGRLLQYRVFGSGNGIIYNDGMLTQRRFSSRDAISISYENLRTRTLFIPLETLRLNLSNAGELGIRVDLNGTLNTEKALESGFKYTVEANKTGYEDADFVKMLQNSKTGLYYDSNFSRIEALNKRYNTPVISPNAGKTHYSLTPPGNETGFGSDQNMRRLFATFNSLNDIYSRYLQLPGNMPQRVKELALSISAGKADNYSKAKAVEKYLSENYPYTLTPKPTPRNRDFTDYFLFDLKEGYCTYYATAMTILVRSLGIPARYVEGFVMPMYPKTGSTYEISNEQAHAWVEVYFEGYGWVPFEPTAPFSPSFYNRQTPVGAVSSAFADNPGYSGYMKWLNQFNVKVEIPEQQAAAVSSDTTVKQSSRVPVRGKSLAVILTALAILILIFISVFNEIRHKSRLNRLYKLEPNKSILGLYKYYMNIFALQDITIESGETPFQFAGRADALFAFSKPLSFEDVTGIFVVSRYGRNGMNTEDKEFVYGFHKNVLENARKHLGVLRYFMYKNLLGKI